MIILKKDALHFLNGLFLWFVLMVGKQLIKKLEINTTKATNDDYC